MGLRIETQGARFRSGHEGPAAQNGEGDQNIGSTLPVPVEAADEIFIAQQAPTPVTQETVDGIIAKYGPAEGLLAQATDRLFPRTIPGQMGLSPLGELKRFV